jgi:hypothetical protein
MAGTNDDDQDPGPNTEQLEGDLDVQWVAAVSVDDGDPTPAAGDSTSPNADWMGVDSAIEDAEDPDDDPELGQPVE